MAKGKKEIKVQAEIECKVCKKKMSIDVPVTCETKLENGKEVLECDIVGSIEDYLPKCSCGGEFKAIKEKLISYG